MIYNELVIDPALTIAITPAKIHQAVISSAAAQVITMAPIRVLFKPRSWTIRANTGNAVILIAIPRNNPKDKKATPAGAYCVYIV